MAARDRSSSRVGQVRAHREWGARLGSRRTRAARPRAGPTSRVAIGIIAGAPPCCFTPSGEPRSPAVPECLSSPASDTRGTRCPVLRPLLRRRALRAILVAVRDRARRGRPFRRWRAADRPRVHGALHAERAGRHHWRGQHAAHVPRRRRAAPPPAAARRAAQTTTTTTCWTAATSDIDNGSRVRRSTRAPTPHAATPGAGVLFAWAARRRADPSRQRRQPCAERRQPAQHGPLSSPEPPHVYPADGGRRGRRAGGPHRGRGAPAPTQGFVDVTDIVRSGGAGEHGSRRSQLGTGLLSRPARAAGQLAAAYRGQRPADAQPHGLRRLRVRGVHGMRRPARAPGGHHAVGARHPVRAARRRRGSASCSLEGDLGTVGDSATINAAGAAGGAAARAAHARPPLPRASPAG